MSSKLKIAGDSSRHFTRRPWCWRDLTCFGLQLDALSPHVQARQKGKALRIFQTCQSGELMRSGVVAVANHDGQCGAVMCAERWYNVWLLLAQMQPISELKSHPLITNANPLWHIHYASRGRQGSPLSIEQIDQLSSHAQVLTKKSNIGWRALAVD